MYKAGCVLSWKMVNCADNECSNRFKLFPKKDVFTNQLEELIFCNECNSNCQKENLENHTPSSDYNFWSDDGGDLNIADTGWNGTYGLSLSRAINIVNAAKRCGMERHTSNSYDASQPYVNKPILDPEELINIVQLSDDMLKYDIAIICIQSNFRGYLVRQKYYKTKAITEACFLASKSANLARISALEYYEEAKKAVKIELNKNKVKIVNGKYTGYTGFRIKTTHKMVCVLLDFGTVYISKNSIKPAEIIVTKYKRGKRARCLDTGISGTIIKETNLGTDLYLGNEKTILCDNVEMQY